MQQELGLLATKAARLAARLDQVFWPIFHSPFAHIHKLCQLGHLYRDIFESPFLTALHSECVTLRSHLHSATKIKVKRRGRGPVLSLTSLLRSWEEPTLQGMQSWGDGFIRDKSC